MELLLAQILRGALKISEPIVSLTRLHGDASYRTYFRVTLEGGHTLIVMQLPEGIASASEEVTNLKGPPGELPFIEIDRYLRKIGLPVPQIHHYDKAGRLLILEDFGDEPLAKRLASAPPKEGEGWLRKAIDLLILLEKRGTERGDRCIAHQRSFDETLLNWEFQHFLEYGIEARTGLRIAETDLKTIRQGTNFITYALTRLPQTLTHRDFQSRNLMIQEETLKLIDFQDALMGPLPYDLVALLRDSYIEQPRDLVDRLIAYYLEARRREISDEIEPAFFTKMFDWMTIQRKLKDAGRFVYIDRVKKNRSFLKFIPASLRYVREAFERQGELTPLFEALRKYVEEFR